MKTKIAFALLLTFFFGNLIQDAYGQAKLPQNVKQKLLTYLTRASSYGFSGQVLVAERGEILLNKAYGLADRKKRIANTLSTPFNIASFTKQFTASAILRLEADGKLSTNDPISKYLDNVPNDKASLTIHQLLTHTSGMSRGPDGKRHSISRDEVVAAILKQPLAGNVGEKFLYSNSGYHLLAAIIEIVSGQTYPEYVTEKLFKPAEMVRSGFYPDDKWSKVLVAQPYNEWKKLPSFTEWNKVWNYGAGSVVSTTGDLYNWFSALIDNRILARDLKEKLFRSYVRSFDENTDYGYGWYIEKQQDGSSLIFHGGDNPGYHSEFRWYVKEDRVIIILTNYDQLEPDGVAIQKRVIANNLYRIMVGEEYNQPPASISLPIKYLKAYEGEYVLSGGGKFKVWSNGIHLNISAEGQEAINVIAGYESGTAKIYAAANALAGMILTSITKGEEDKIRTRISPGEFDFYIPFLVEQLEDFKKNLGALKAFKVQGTTSFPWDKENWRTYVVLCFEKGSTDLFMGWQNGRLNDVTTESGRPFPLIMPLVPNSKLAFSTFEFLRSRETRISFRRENALSIKTNSTNLIAWKKNENKWSCKQSIFYQH